MKQIKLFGNKTDDINDGDIFTAKVESVEGRKVVVLVKKSKFISHPNDCYFSKKEQKKSERCNNCGILMVGSNIGQPECSICIMNKKNPELWSAPLMGVQL